MNKFPWVTLFTLLLASFAAKAQIDIKSNGDTIGVNNVYEITINHPKSYNNNWEDVAVKAVFNGPVTINISGFFFTDNVWKVRFAPPQTGDWTYTIVFSTPTNSYTASGSFKVVASDTKGFLRQHPKDQFRLIYPDGTLFNGLGIEDCVLDYNGNGTPLDDFGFDGDFRTATYTGSRTTLNTYMTAYGAKGAGFNLFRWTTDNCSFRLYNNITATGNTYLINEGLFGDTLVRSLRDNKMRIWLTFFGVPVFGNINSSTPQEEAAIKRYIDYVMARYGAYTDIWELFNESSASDYYYQSIASYVKSIDPYKRLISVSDERPQLPVIDINSPHWYEKESELQSDTRAWQMITSRKTYNKPIIFGEQGNSVQCWDPLSALRMRIRSWTSFFAEGILIFWNASWAKDYMHPVAANIYLGPVERGYIKALNQYSSVADTSIVPFTISPLNPKDVRAYGLGGKNNVFAYFHHYSSHDNNITTNFNYRMHKPGTIYWINPADNTIISSYKLNYGSQIISSPPFQVDLAMRIDLDTSNSPFNEAEKLDLLLYPNPAKTEFLLNGNFNNTVAIDMYDINGRRVFYKNNVYNDERINIAGLKNGIYIYVVKSDARKATGKLMVFR